MRAKYKMSTTVELEGSDGWDDSCKLDQVFKQAQDDANYYTLVAIRCIKNGDLQAMKDAGTQFKILNNKLKVSEVTVVTE